MGQEFNGSGERNNLTGNFLLFGESGSQTLHGRPFIGGADFTQFTHTYLRGLLNMFSRSIGIRGIDISEMHFPVHHTVKSIKRGRSSTNLNFKRSVTTNECKKDGQHGVVHVRLEEINPKSVYPVLRRVLGDCKGLPCVKASVGRL